MATFLIGYDLNRAHQNYAGLIEAIKKLGAWWHHLDSTWLVKSESNCTSIRESLLRYIDSNDELLVVKLTGEGAWSGFSAVGSQWLKNNL